VYKECPHLGLPGDKEVHFGYPNAMNVCYADQNVWSKFQPVEQSQQQQFCLTPDYALCPIFLRQAAGSKPAGKKKQSRPYLDFYGLHEEPFSIVPQPRFLCESQSQQQALTGLRWLVDRRQGLGLLLGHVGTGKTLLCQTLAEELNADPLKIAALMLTPSQRTEYALMADLLALWKIAPRRLRSLRDLEAAAHDFLVQNVLGQHKTLVLILDEAQTLTRRQYLQICKLLNWQDGGEQLLQVILAGQPGLRSKMRCAPALCDRVVVEFALTAMALPDVQRMISERLRRAGRRGDLFAPSATNLIYQHTGGMPRLVTILCLRCMWLAYQEDERYITADLVRAVVEQAKASELFALPRAKTALTAAERSWPTSPEPLSGLPRLLERFRSLVTP
jgi:general secretion pathway protein A